MNWQKSYDNMLARGPQDDGFQNWCEDVVENMSNEFWDKNEDWVMDDDTANSWFNKLIDKSPKDAAAIIERAHRIFIEK
jgi:hypothetical protein